MCNSKSLPLLSPLPALHFHFHLHLYLDLRLYLCTFTFTFTYPLLLFSPPPLLLLIRMNSVRSVFSVWVMSVGVSPDARVRRARSHDLYVSHVTAASGIDIPHGMCISQDGCVLGECT
jgi:hypothetical protein